MESGLLETMKEEEDYFEDLSLMHIKIEPEDADMKDMDNCEYAMERYMDDGEALNETKAEPNFERVSEETKMEVKLEVAENTWNMESKKSAMKRENDDEEALMEPVFVPFDSVFEGTSKEAEEEIPESTEMRHKLSATLRAEEAPCEEDEDCAAAICLHPTGSPILWVQCDGRCNKWFHFLCEGLEENDLNDVDEYICNTCRTQSISADLPQSSSSDLTLKSMDLSMGFTSRTSRQTYMECCLYIASSSGSLSDKALGTCNEDHLSRNCSSSEVQCQMSLAVAACSAATWGYLSEKQEEEQIAGTRQIQPNNRSDTERDFSDEGTISEREMQSSATLSCSSKKSERKCRRRTLECSTRKTQLPSECLFDNRVQVHTVENLYKSSHCEKSFSSKGILTQHLGLHSGEKLYNCGKCDKSFNRRSNLIRHMCIHRGEKPYKCSECDKLFSQKVSLTVHMRLHTGERPYKCTYCEKSFSATGSLISHKRLHTGQKPYKCSDCDKSFSQKVSLTVHMRLHTGERPYKCTYCEKSFNQKSKLNSHMHVHTSEKSYKCSECDESFRWKYSLIRHRRVHTGEKPYMCSFCEKSFNSKGNLSKHIRLHICEKPYKCSECNKSFSRKGSFTLHMHLHRGE